MKKIFTAFMMMLCAVCAASAANYLTFTAEEDGATFGVAHKGEKNPDIQYSLDGGETWTALAAGDTITLAHKGDKALLRGDNQEGISKGYSECSSFTMTGKIAASGSVMSLIDGIGKTLVVPAGYCFYALFKGCTSLTQAPELPATTLSEGCYSYMFNGCTSLTQAPELPATTLANSCYSSMFYDCSNLTQAPELPATTLANSCYSRMFFGTNLSEIHVSFDDWGESTHDWVANVAPTGTFYCPKALSLEFGRNRIPEDWKVKYIDDTAAVVFNYLVFTAEEDGSTFGIRPNSGDVPYVKYSLDDGETWNKLKAGDVVELAHKGDKALLKGNNRGGFSKNNHMTSFTMKGKIAASGNVMSLIDEVGYTTEIPEMYCFRGLFIYCVALTQAPELPATKLRQSCYSGMFEGCTSLTQAPELPAPTLEYACYGDMFKDCIGLTKAPELPATKLDGFCYSDMFSGCTSLTQAPELPVTTLADGCYYGMFGGCTSLTQAPELPATKLTYACYDRMFWGCTSLAQAPELPATTLADDCYMGMFASCTSLTQAPELPVTELAERCYDKMFWGCTGLTEAPELPATTLRYYCYHGMFIGCTGLTRAPELPATTMAEYCYGSMFYRCSGLKQAPELPATTLATSCYNSMFDSCISLTQAPELPATTLADDCYDKMFKGCTGLTHAPELPAAKLTSDCYSSMFSGCTNLSEISAAFLWWRNTSDWVADVAPTGTFYCSKELPLEYGVSAIPEGWTVKYPDGSTVEYVDVSTTLADNISVWSDDLTVYVRGAEGEVSLYDLSGKRVAVSVSADEERALSVPAKGVYVVRTNNGTSDVLVR